MCLCILGRKRVRKDKDKEEDDVTSEKDDGDSVVIKPDNEEETEQKSLSPQVNEIESSNEESKEEEDRKVINNSDETEDIVTTTQSIPSVSSCLSTSSILDTVSKVTASDEYVTPRGTVNSAYIDAKLQQLTPAVTAPAAIFRPLNGLAAQPYYGGAGVIARQPPVGALSAALMPTSPLLSMQNPYPNPRPAAQTLVAMETIQRNATSMTVQQQTMIAMANNTQLKDEDTGLSEVKLLLFYTVLLSLHALFS